MNYDVNFGSRVKCTESEKKHSLVLLREILEQSKKARTAGFLVLGQDSDSISNTFLKDGIKLIGKGYDYSSVEKILDIKIAVRNAQGIHLLEMAMIREGCTFNSQKRPREPYGRDTVLFSGLINIRNAFKRAE